jgi:2-methylcitrate dehydratase PrpD
VTLPSPDSPSHSRESENESQSAAIARVITRLIEGTPAPDFIRDKAALLLLDTLGCIMAGRQSAELEVVERNLGRLDSGAFRFPGGPSLSVHAAAGIAAMASAWDEACEGLPYAHGRPGLALIGALLPLAVVQSCSLGELLASLRLGYEVGARAGGWLRIRPGMHVDGNWPAIGVAAGVGHLMGLPADRIWHAINIAACQLPASLYAPIRSGDMARNTYLAHCAQLGLLAASSAAGGITAPADAMSQYAAGHSVAVDTATPSADHDFMLESYLKPHASVRHAHYGLEAAIRIRERLGIETPAITAIRLEVYEEAATYAGNRAPERPLTGQFSLSLAVAAGLRFGAMGPEIYRADRFHDPELRRLEALTEVVVRPDLGNAGRRAAILTVAAGSKHEIERADSVEGSPERPLSRDAVIEKFVRHACAQATEKRARNFATAMLEGKPDQDFGALWWRLIVD